MPLPDKGPYLVRYTPAAPLAGDDMAERPAGRAWLAALTSRGQAGADQLFRARGYARTAPVTQLVLEPGTVRCWINEKPRSNGTVPAYLPQPNPTIRIPTLDTSQWRDLTLITRHLADRWSAMPADDVLVELAAAGDHNGIRLLPTLDACAASCSCPTSKTALCKHAATALVQVARILDVQPLALLVLRGRSAMDFFAGLHDPGHRSLQPHYWPTPAQPPVDLAAVAYDQWAHYQAPVPSRLVPPSTAREPEPVALPGIDITALHLIAVDTAHRAHALLNTLTSPGFRAKDSARTMPTDPAHDAARLAAHHELQLPHQRRLQQALGVRGEDITHTGESSTPASGRDHQRGGAR
ncbi:hypothetical protein ACGF5O_44900 [Streptomyces sp. NPDC048291]|uniref:hypothetical protein n=1 Tax=unclassified Streptomyces TaxID=2593676 RepID=UPI0034463C93